MSILAVGLIMVGIIFLLVGSSLWVGISLGLAGALGFYFFTSCPAGPSAILTSFSVLNNFSMVALPLFVFMGELLFRSGASGLLYSGITPWLSRMPGGLLHTNVMSCCLFAAISGTSSATCATIGTVAIPELDRRGYDRRLTIGSLCGAGTLGLLIPPSIVMIIYGALVGESVGQLFLAGFIPGILVAILFMVYIATECSLRPQLTPPAEIYSWKDRMVGLVKIMPVFGVIIAVLGLIYAGVTTPTEAGAIGVFCAFIVVTTNRSLSWRLLLEALSGAVRISCMVMLIIAGASVLASAIAYLRIPQELARFIVGLGLSKWVIFSVLSFIYLFLGCLFDGISMMVLTLPIVYPLIIGLGFNGIWFGVALVILIEVAQITPPVGFNLYILRTLSGEPLAAIFKDSVPFALLLLVGLVIISFFPQLALWLPSIMIR